MAADKAAGSPRYRMVRGLHLTATDRQLVAFVLAGNTDQAHTKTKRIRVTLREPGRMDFTITTKQLDDWGRPAPRTANYQIEISE